MGRQKGGARQKAKRRRSPKKNPLTLALQDYPMVFAWADFDWKTLASRSPQARRAPLIAAACPRKLGPLRRITPAWAFADPTTLFNGPAQQPAYLATMARLDNPETI